MEQTATLPASRAPATSTTCGRGGAGWFGRRALFGGGVGLALLLLAGGCHHRGTVKAIDGLATLEIPAGAEGEDAKADHQTHRVELATGDHLNVRLGAFGGTGYTWELVGPAPAVLNTEGAPVTARAQPAADGNTPVGASTWTTFRFRAIAQGHGDLRFVLRRVWEPAAEAARTVDVPVVVKPDTLSAPARE